MAGRRRALCVGIDQYRTPANNLNSCANDARAFEALLSEEYDFTEIHRLFDRDATLQNVTEELDWLLADVDADDRCVYVQSSHGARIAEGSQYKEVLVMSDESFLSDQELVRRTQVLPPHVLLAFCDTCHSGGFNKLFLYDDGGIEFTKVKAWSPGPEQLEQLEANLADVTEVKLFGCPPSDNAAVLSKGFVPSADGMDPMADGMAPAFKNALATSDQVEMNGLLVAACLAEETALAATSKTKGLSVFTFYFLEAIKRLGPGSSTLALRTEAHRQIRAQGYAQTPVVKPPRNLPALDSRPFVLMPLGATLTGSSGSVFDRLSLAIQEALKAFQASEQGA